MTHDTEMITVLLHYSAGAAAWFLLGYGFFCIRLDKIISLHC